MNYDKFRKNAERYWRPPEEKHCPDDVELEVVHGNDGVMFNIDTVYDIIKPRMSIMEFGKNAFFYGDGENISYNELKCMLNHDGTYDWLILEFDGHYYLRKKEFITLNG